MVNISTAQPPMLWSRCYGGSGSESGYSIRQTSDGGFVVAGYTSSNDGDVSGNHGANDYWIIKTDDNGVLQWQECLGGTGYEEAFSVKQTDDKGFIIAGYTSSNDGDVTGNHGSYDFWVVKLDSSGAMEWQKTLGGSGDDLGYGVRNVVVEQCSDGGYFVSGGTSSNDGDVSGNHGDYDYWLAKLDPLGNIIWQKCYGGSLEERFKDMRLTQDGGTIMAGWSYSNDGDLVGLNFFSYPGSWIVKTDSLGAIQWQLNYLCIDTMDPTCSGRMFVSSICQTPSGQYIAGNALSWFNNHSEYSTTTINLVGQIMSNAPLIGDPDHYYFPNTINSTSNGEFVLTGCKDSNWSMYIVHSQWTYSWGQPSFLGQAAYETIETNDGGFAIVGDEDIDTSCDLNFWDQLYIIKLGGVVSVEQHEKTELSLFLDNQNLTMTYDSKINGKLKLVICDASGRKVFSSDADTQVGFNKKQIPLYNLSKGVYFVSMMGERTYMNAKFIR